jgi:hypothetical protein
VARAHAYAIAAVGDACAIDLNQRVAGLDASAARSQPQEDATAWRPDDLVA